MSGDGRLLIVLPLHLFFGAKLLVTAALLWRTTQALWSTWNPFFGLLALGLGRLAALQLSSMIGIASRRDETRRLAVRMCVAGGTVGVVLCLVAPLAWYLAIFVLALGLLLGLLNGLVLVLLLSELAREWCDELRSVSGARRHHGGGPSAFRRSLPPAR